MQISYANKFYKILHALSLQSKEAYNLEFKTSNQSNINLYT